MPERDNAPLPQRIVDALALANRGAGWRGVLADQVLPVVEIPTSGEQSAGQLGFNDNETTNDSAFGKRSFQPPVAGQLSHVQLKNPAGSGRIVFLDTITATCSGADLLMHGMMDADATTDDGVGVNKNNGGSVAGIAKGRRMANAASQLDSELGHVRLAANTTQVIELNPPIRLLAGEGYAVRCSTVNLQLEISYQYREYLAG